MVFFLVASVGLSSCEQLSQLGLTEEEIAAGLKSALTVGTDTAVTLLHATDGYFADQAVKILMPEEAAILVDNIGLIPGGQTLLNQVILSMNRAAEDAAVEATPIFVNAITQMTIVDALSILQGTDTAATQYLRLNTFSQLRQLFAPKIEVSLSKPLVAGISASQSWAELTGTYNTLANSIAGQLAGLTPVNTSLSDHVTSKALNGLFLKVGQEEADIRNNPSDRVNDILIKVFGN